MDYICILYSILFCLFLLPFCFFLFLGLHPRYIEVPRLRVESEPQLPAYTTATAMQDLSHVCDLHHISQQRQILKPLSEARDGTCNLTVPSRIRFHCATMGTPLEYILLKLNSEKRNNPVKKWAKDRNRYFTEEFI